MVLQLYLVCLCRIYLVRRRSISSLITSPTMGTVLNPATSVTSDIASPLSHSYQTFILFNFTKPSTTNTLSGKPWDITPSWPVPLRSHRGDLHWPETRSSRVASGDARFLLYPLLIIWRFMLELLLPVLLLLVLHALLLLLNLVQFRSAWWLEGGWGFSITTKLILNASSAK